MSSFCGVLQALVLRSLDVPHADRVMTLQPKEGGPFLSYPDVLDVRDGNSLFSAVAAFEVQDFGLEANGVTRPVWGRPGSPASQNNNFQARLGLSS